MAVQEGPYGRSSPRWAIFERIEVQIASHYMTDRGNINDAGFAVRTGFGAREKERHEQLGEIEMAYGSELRISEDVKTERYLVHSFRTGGHIPALSPFLWAGA